jgi:hypothetical protein
MQNHDEVPIHAILIDAIGYLALRADRTTRRIEPHFTARELDKLRARLATLFDTPELPLAVESLVRLAGQLELEQGARDAAKDLLDVAATAIPHLRAQKLAFIEAGHARQRHIERSYGVVADRTAPRTARRHDAPKVAGSVDLRDLAPPRRRIA